MLVGVALLPPPSLPPSFSPFGTQAFYIINRPNCVKICNRVYMDERKVVMRNNKVIYRSAVMLTAHATFTVGLLSQILFIFLGRSERNWGLNSHCAFVVQRKEKRKQVIKHDYTLQQNILTETFIIHVQLSSQTKTFFITASFY